MSIEVESTDEVTQVATLAPLNESLAIEQQREAGLNALARMTEPEFVARMQSLKLGLDRFDMMMREVLEADVDIMHIDGVEKPILTLSGAEKICFVTRLVPTFDIAPESGGGVDEPAIRYVIKCNLHLGNESGPVVAQGVGAANSFERKYRWRYAEKKCPECGVIGSLFKSKHTAKPSSAFAGTKPYFCWSKKGGCGKEFAENDVRITQQTLGMVENPDPYDLDNTLLKMAKKRALVDAAKTATASSGRITVDLDEDGATSNEAEHLRGVIMECARGLGWSKLGDIFTVVQKATGKPIKTQAEFMKLKATELAKVFEMMPKPTTRDESSDKLGATSDGAND